ncbi:MAG: Ig-like domain-containing protein [Clostridia bacterium]|nr:Ig-like domain-containing protein [Clostridia bacterium]
MFPRRIRRLAALLTALVMLGGIADCDIAARALSEEMLLEEMPLAEDTPLAPEAPAEETLPIEETLPVEETPPAQEEPAAGEMEAAGDVPLEEAPAEELPPEEIPAEEAAPEPSAEPTPEPTQEPAVDATLPPDSTPEATAEPTPEPAPLTYTYSVRAVRDPLAEIALPIIISNEGSYTAVNADDNGALSIGKIQWHAGRALSLMRRIVALNPDQAMNILGEALYNEITDSSTKWTTRIVDSAEKVLISKLLGTSEGKYAQDEQALDDVSGYLQNGRSKGLIYDGALIYFADIENQNGAGGSGRIARTAIANAGGASAVTLEVIHETALADEKVGRYATRRNRTYNKIKALKLDDEPDVSEGIRIVGVKYPSTYLISSAGYTVSSGTISSDAELKSLTIDIQSSDGTSISSMPKTWPLSGKTRSLSSFDDEIPFSKIAEPGSYIWIIAATDEKGRTAEVRLPFTAVKSGSTQTGTGSSEAPAPVVKVSSIELNKSSLSLEAGEAAALSAAVLPENAADRSLSWSSSDASVATVSGGLVLAVAPGAAEIICKSNDGGAEAACTVTVTLLPEDMAIIVPEGYLGLGQSVPLQVKFSPEGSSAALKWSSSNEKYVSVDENGVVTGEKLGNATVTVRSENGLKDTIKVKVVDPRVATAVILDQSGTITLNLGETLQLNAEISPATAETSLKWSTSSTRYVKVNQDGLIYGSRVGSATITVKTANGKKDTVKVKVVDPTKAASVTLDQSGTVQLNIGETLQLNAEVLPATAETSLKWSTSSSSRAKVSQDGLVSARKAGSATITVKTSNGKTDTVKIKVVDPTKATSVTIDSSGAIAIGVGEKLQLSAAVLPETAETSLSWSSKSTRYAKVNQNGVVTGVRKGTTTITVKTDNGKTDTVKIKVQ